MRQSELEAIECRSSQALESTLVKVASDQRITTLPRQIRGDLTVTTASILTAMLQK